MFLPTAVSNVLFGESQDKEMTTTDSKEKDTDDKKTGDVAIEVVEEGKQEETGDWVADFGKKKDDDVVVPLVEEDTAKQTDDKVVRRSRELSPEQVMFRRIGIAIISFLLLLAGIIILSYSLKKVTTTEVGLKYKRWRKELDDAAKSGGLFLGPPGFRFIKFPST